MLRMSAALVIVLLTTPIHIGADAEIGEWVGVYSMNHDGFQGTLRIEDTKRDCATPGWCHLRISYVGADGVTHVAAIRVVDQAGQRMVFYIAFPGNRQQFDAYLMSWDKSRMAGTTTWQGRTFGFYAVKAAPESAARLPVRPGVLVGRGNRQVAVMTPVPQTQPSGTPGSSQATINADGEVETALPDGSKRLTRPGECGFTIVRPDGSRSRASCNQVQPATPPIPDAVSGKWLEAHNSYLLDIIRSLLGNDQASVDNYLRTSESSTLGVFDRIRIRTALIALLTS